jgi:hypothetical protein
MVGHCHFLSKLGKNNLNFLRDVKITLNFKNRLHDDQELTMKMLALFRSLESVVGILFIGPAVEESKQNLNHNDRSKQPKEIF